MTVRSPMSPRRRRTPWWPRFTQICAGASAGRTRGIDDILGEAGRTLTNAGPTVVADGADNPGGGAGCDSTFILKL